MLRRNREPIDNYGVKELIINQNYSHLVLSSKTDEGENVPKIRKKTIPTKQLNEIIKQHFLTSNRQILLPENCKFLKQYPSGDKLLIIEEKPQVRTISVDLSLTSSVARLEKTGKLKLYGLEKFLEENERPYKLQLSFPYIVYFVSLDFDNELESMDIFYRLSPITSYADYLFQTNLLNVSRDNSLCLGDINVEGNRTVKNIVESSITAFWDNEFNSDYILKYQLYQNTEGVEDLLTWAYNTSVDPMFIFNVSWMRYENNVDRHIKNKEDGNENDSNFNCFQLLDGPRLSSKMEKPPAEIYIEENITESILLEERVLSIGESFKYKNGKEVYVNSFLGIDNAVSIIQIEDWNGRLLNLKATNDVKDFIEKQIYKRESINSATLENGQEIKNNNILVVDFPFKSFRRVDDIRKCRDGKTEVKLGDDYYLLDNLQATIFDENNFEFKGTVFEKGKEYVVLNNYSSGYRNEILKTGFIRKYTGIESSIDYRYMKLKFIKYNNDIDDYDENYYDEIDLSKHECYPLDQLKTLDCQVFSVGSMLYGTNDIYKVNDTLLDVGHRYPTYRKPDMSQMLSCIKEDRLTIPNYESHIEFKIGDNVVVADWSNPDSIGTIRKIEKFEHDEEFIYIITSDSSGVELKIPYISIKNTRARIGYVRRITDSYENLKSGMKIKAQEKGISNFPMKDTNTIIGFLNDTGSESLVLLSNGCTLQPSIVREPFFEIIEENSQRWNELTSTKIEPRKIKFQAGDILTRDGLESISPTHVIAYHRQWKSPKLITVGDLKDASGYSMISISTFRGFSRFGFPSPRRTQYDLEMVPKIKGIPNMHNGYIEFQQGRLLFPYLEGRYDV